MFIKRFFGKEKTQQNDRNGKIVPFRKPGPAYSNPCYRLASNCKHQSEPYVYLCLKCGDCGRKFIRNKMKE